MENDSVIRLDKEEILPADFQGWSYESEIFQNLVKQTRPTTIIEVGTWKGMSAIKLYKAAESLCRPFELICVDTWLGGIEHYENALMKRKHHYPQIYYQFLSNMHHADCIDNLVVVPNTSLIGARYLKSKNKKAQLIYIDGSHETPDVYFDIKFYYELLADGGIIFGDDYFYEPLQHDVNFFVKENNLLLQIEENNYWKIVKN